MWTFLPGMRLMITLAIMEAPKENTYYITKFFELFQEAMREYLKDKDYSWKPNVLMMDEKGVNFVAAENVFGKDFIDNFTMTCHYHFKNCAEQKMQEKNVPHKERRTFRKWISELCNASTLPTYYNICAKIERKVLAYGLQGWWHWWRPRGFHLVPALRGFNLPRSNMAEGGQSKLKGDRKISLIESVLEDAVSMLVQAANYENFLDNAEKVRG